MSWVGKVLGGTFGFLMGGPLGAALGAALGHQLDQTDAEIRFEALGATADETEVLRRSFFVSTFHVMGHVAKADGRVSAAEIHVARSIMDRMMLSEDLKLLSMRLFNEGKSDRFAVSASVADFKTSCSRYPQLLRLFWALQLEMALADGAINQAAEQSLLEICGQLGFSRYEFFGIKARLETERRFGSPGRRENLKNGSGRFGQNHQQRTGAQGETLEVRRDIQAAYAVLQLPTSASDAEIKKAYRRLISRHHPDKVSGEGVGDDRVKRATEATQRIQKAYDLICKTRHF